MRIKPRKKFKAFSLVETLVTLGIFSILISMLSNILILNLQVSAKITARTRVREELSEFVGLMQRDMRNAVKIYNVECGGKTNSPIQLPENSGYNSIGCKADISKYIIWVQHFDDQNSTYCSHYTNGVIPICKLEYDTGTNSWKTVYKTSEILNITNFSIEKNIVERPDKTSKAIIVITIQAEGSNPDWEITNQVRQVTITTRNF